MYPFQETTNTIIIEKSRFICYLKRVANEEEYKEYLAAVRKKHHDATHVCSALICHNIQRSSDDGEPSGTAGAPMLNVLSQNHLDETCALVVRYFGGIKLGAGGLIRAYTRSVSECLKNSRLAQDLVCPRYTLTLPYDQANRIMNQLRNDTILLDTVYDTQVTFVFALADDKKLDSIISLAKGTLPIRTGTETIQKVVEL